MPWSQFPSADLPVLLWFSHLLPQSVLGTATRSQFIAILLQCFAISLRRPQILTCTFQLLELWNKFCPNLLPTVLHAQILWVRNLDREQWRWFVSVPWSLGCFPRLKDPNIWKLTHSHIWWVMQAVGWDLCLAFSLNNSAWLFYVAWSSSQHGGWVPRRRRILDWAPNLRS